jgi:hypothetical protein
LSCFFLELKVEVKLVLELFLDLDQHAEGNMIQSFGPLHCEESVDPSSMFVILAFNPIEILNRN